MSDVTLLLQAAERGERDSGHRCMSKLFNPGWLATHDLDPNTSFEDWIQAGSNHAICRPRGIIASRVAASVLS